MHSNLSKSVPPLPSRRSYDLSIPFVPAKARRAQSLYCADCLSKSKLGLGVSPKRRNKAIAPYKKSRSQAQSPRCRPRFRGAKSGDPGAISAFTPVFNALCTQTSPSLCPHSRRGALTILPCRSSRLQRVGRNRFIAPTAFQNPSSASGLVRSGAIRQLRPTRNREVRHSLPAVVPTSVGANGGCCSGDVHVFSCQTACCAR